MNLYRITYKSDWILLQDFPEPNLSGRRSRPVSAYFSGLRPMLFSHLRRDSDCAFAHCCQVQGSESGENLPKCFENRTVSQYDSLFCCTDCRSKARRTDCVYHITGTALRRTANLHVPCFSLCCNPQLYLWILSWNEKNRSTSRVPASGAAVQSTFRCFFVSDRPAFFHGNPCYHRSTGHGLRRNSLSNLQHLYAARNSVFSVRETSGFSYTGKGTASPFYSLDGKPGVTQSSSECGSNPDSVASSNVWTDFIRLLKYIRGS